MSNRTHYPTSWPESFEKELIGRRCYENFYAFALLAFGIKRHPRGPKWFDPNIHKPFCDWFQHHTLEWLARRKRGENGRYYMAAIVPRAVGKSTLGTRAGNTWLGLRDPSLAIYIGNETGDNAEAFLKGIADQLSGDDDYSWFRWLYGNWKSALRKWTSDYIIHAARVGSRQDASFGAWGIRSGLTGKHPDVLCLDDLDSYDAREKDTNWPQRIKDAFSSLIPVVESDGLVQLFGTRYGDDDIFEEVFESDGIASVAGMADSAYKPNGGRWHVFYWSGQNPDGSPACPKTWPIDEMEAWERRDAVKFAAQVLNNPKAVRNKPITEDQINARLVSSTDIPQNIRITLHLDLALKDQERKRRGDETVILALGHHRERTGKVWFLGAEHSNEWTAEDFKHNLLKIIRGFNARKQKVVLMTMETGIEAGRIGTFELLLKNWFAEANLTMPEIVPIRRPQNKGKKVRIAESIPFILDKKVFFLADAPGLADLRYQLTNIWGAKHDDFSESFADGFDQEVYRAMTRITTTEEGMPNVPWQSTLKNQRRYDNIQGDDMPRKPV